MSTNEPTGTKPVYVDVFEMRFIGAALRRHGWIVLGAGILGALIGYSFSVMSQPVYRAEAVLLVNIQALKLNAEGMSLDVEVIRPARRLIGTVCESDKAMSMLAERLDGERFGDAGKQQAQRIAWLGERLYYDQRGLEMATLRAVASDPGDAAWLANTWAEVCQQLMREAYGTTADDLMAIKLLAEEAKRDVLEAEAGLNALSKDATEADRLERADALDKSQRLLTGLNERWAQLKVRLTDSEEIARIISPAAPPAYSINSSPRVVIGLFGIAGLLLGMTIALLRGPGRHGLAT